MGSTDERELYLAVIADQRYLGQTMPRALVDALTRRGVRTDLLCAEECQFDPSSGVVRTPAGERNLADYDGIVARTRHGLGLVMLAYAEAHALPVINSYAATERIRNKAEMAIVLSQAGVRGAFTLLAPDVRGLAALPRQRFPLILKPRFGDNSRGLFLVREPADLEDVDWTEDVVLAQSYLPNDGYDLKLYVCGQTVFAVRKPSPFNDDPSATPHRVEPDVEMIELALRCGAAFGLEVYGVDTIQSPDGLFVIEVNEFPNFTGLDEAPDCLATHVIERMLSCKFVREAQDADRILAGALRA
jgi:ribosomal protein S6--L-glutamate ligase